MNNSTIHLHLRHVKLVSIPALSFVVTVMSLGVIGNGLVLMVYGHKLQRPSNYRSFVLMLAGIDMVSCCIGMPGILVDMLNPSSSVYSDVACKLFRLLTHGIVSASAMTHLLIGIERYRRICKPFKRQITTRGSKVVLISIVLLSIVISLPAYMMYGKCQFELKAKNITITICTITMHYAQTSLPAVYESILFSLQVLTVLALFVMYILVAKQIWKAKRAIQPFLKRFSYGINRNDARTKMIRSVTDHFSEFKSSMLNRFHPKSKIDSSNTNENTRDTRNQKWINAKEISKRQENGFFDNETNTEAVIYSISDRTPTLPLVNEEIDVSDVFQSRISDVNVTTETTPTRAQKSRLSSTRTTSTKSGKKHSRKVTAVSGAITFIFIISYVPYFIIVWMSIERQRNIHMTPAEEALYRICGLSYIINNAANFFVYILMDNDFRAKCKQCLCKCFVKR